MLNYSDIMWSNAYGSRRGKGGNLKHQHLLDGVGVVVQVPATLAQSLGFSAHTFEAIGLPHRVQLSFPDEVSNMIETRGACVLEEDERGSLWNF